MSLRDRLRGGLLPPTPYPVQESPPEAGASVAPPEGGEPWHNATTHRAADRLRQLLPAQPKQGSNAQPQTAPESNESSETLEKIRSLLHVRLLGSLNIPQGSNELDAHALRDAAQQLLVRLLETERIPLSKPEQAFLLEQLLEDMLGYGPLEPLLRDPSVSDILVNGPYSVYVERHGKLTHTAIRFRDEVHLRTVIDRIVSAVGRRVDEKNPMVDARLRDGSRFNAIIPPLALDGPTLSIRKFKRDAATLEQLLAWGSLTPAMANVLAMAVMGRLNIMISGGTGAGKTTLLNALSALIPADERIVTIEDSAELQLQQDHVVRLETRPANIEGEGAITARQLLVNSLRMRPDRIVVGECRSGETLDMLQAMNTGHNGSLTTLHANTPTDALARIETMCLMVPHPLPETTIRQQIASGVNVIVQASRLQDGSRKITSISEVIGLTNGRIELAELFTFKQVGISPEGKVQGVHTATGQRPAFTTTLAEHGLQLNPKWFEPHERPPSPRRPQA
jgi:pilus assembly protein CpaF